MRTAALLALALGLSGLSIGLARGGPPDREVPRQEPGARRGDDMPVPRPPVRPGLPRPPITRACEDIEADARALLDGARACTTSAGCEVMSFEQLVGPESCVMAFQCTTAVSADLDRAAFLEAAAPLVVEKRACGECAMAACVPPAELVASCVEGRCELLPR